MAHNLETRPNTILQAQSRVVCVKVSTGDRPRDHFGAVQGGDSQMLRGDATRKLLDPLSREEEELAR